EPLDKRRADVAIVRPGGGVLWIIAGIQWVRARTSDRHVAMIQVADIRKFEQRQLCVREVGKFRSCQPGEFTKMRRATLHAIRREAARTREQREASDRENDAARPPTMRANRSLLPRVSLGTRRPCRN